MGGMEWEIPIEHPWVQYTAADMLPIGLLNIDEVQSKGKVTLEANIKKLRITFKAHILNIT